MSWQAQCYPRSVEELNPVLALVRELLAIRRRLIVPRFAKASFGKAHAADNGLLTADWRMGDGARLLLRANLSDAPIVGATDQPQGALIWGHESGQLIKPWSVAWRLEER